MTSGSFLCTGVPRYHVAFMSLGSGPPVVFASNIFGDLNSYRAGV